MSKPSRTDMSGKLNEDQRLGRSFLYAAIAVALLWILYTLSWALDWNMSLWGIYPRKQEGLLGILTAPLAHGSWGHLSSNSFPLLFLSAGIMYFYPKVARQVFVTAYLATGLWVWVAARASYHIGASGVVYALAFFLFFIGVFRREVRSLTLSLVVAFFYGGMVWGILPAQPGISWESHLFGGLAGLTMAWYFRKSGPAPKRYYWQDEPDEEDGEDFGPWNYQKLFQK